MDNLEKNIGNNIKEVRLSKGLSQEALAERCKFSNTTLSAYENGRKTPGLATTAKIAKALNVSIERLYYGDENNAFIKVEPDKGKKSLQEPYSGELAESLQEQESQPVRCQLYMH